MALKKLDDLVAGDVVAADLTNGRGVVLIRDGSVFAEAHRRLLRMWGIEAVKVADSALAEVAEDASRTDCLDRAEAQIRPRFGPSLDNTVMAEILRVAVEQRARQMLAQGEKADA